jgi:hypothetical protein
MPGYEQTLHDNETRWLSGPGWLMLSGTESTRFPVVAALSATGVVRGAVIVERRTLCDPHTPSLQSSNPMSTGT